MTASPTSPRCSLTDAAEKIARRDAERVRDANHVEKTNVSFATLDASQIRSVHPSTVRKFLLGNAEPFALCAHPATESLEVGLAHGA